MRATFLRPLTLGALLATLGATGSGAPIPDEGSWSLDLSAQRPAFDPVEGGRYVVPRIAGFGHSARPGEPMLPLQVRLVAIPEGSVPELRVRSARPEPAGALPIAPVPRARVEDRPEAPPGAARRGGPRPGEAAGLPEYTDEFVPDGALGDREFPPGPVRLGRIGHLREQRYVEVLFSPLTYNPARGRASFYPEVRAEVVFHAPAGSAVTAPRPFRPDPLFEEIYRASLENYEQGRLFRAAADERTISEAAPAEAVPAAGPYKVFVSRPGVYRLDHASLQAGAPDLLSADPGTWSLSAEGIEIPIAIRAAGGASGEADGAFGPGDVLEFYGRPKGGPPARLNHDFADTFPDIFEASDFTDTQVYWLSASGAPGSHPRIPRVSGAPAGSGFPTAAHFEEAAVWDENNLYLPLEGNDPYFSVPSLLAESIQATRDITLPLPGLAPVSATASVTVRLRGGSSLAPSPDHRTRVWINGGTAGGADFTWDGDVMKEQTFGEPQSGLSDPATIHFSLPGIPEVSVDRQYIDSVTLRYRRQFAAAGDALVFSYPNQDVRFQIGGFSGAPPVIYEITATVPGSAEAAPVQIDGAAASGAPSTTITFDVPRDPSPAAPAQRAFVVAGPAAVLRPDGIARASDPALRDPSLLADIIVIGALETMDPAAGGALDALLAYRALAQGLTSRVVFVDQIYDEFSFGLRDPNAIRAFLAYAFDNWRGPSGTARPPSFVLLVGDATPDYKNVLGREGWVDQVPTPMMFGRNSILGYYSSDNWLASFRGSDQVPDVFLGRISTRTRAASAAVFDKIRLYEQAPPAGLWKGHAVLLAGDGKLATESGDFEAVQEGLAAASFTIPPFSASRLYFARPPWNGADAAGYRSALVGELDSGAAVLSYVGHGSFETWGLNTFFTARDAAGLTNAGVTPFMVNINCLAGGFHYLDPAGSLGEAMTNNPSGGAIASLAPSGLSNLFVGGLATDELFAPLFGLERQRLLAQAATMMRAALWRQGSIIDLQSYTFLGDPATRIATPAPPRPLGLAATAGNGEVSLSWSPPAEPVAGYRIFRALAPAGPYAPVACDPLSATSCVDRTVINATTYYYYAASTDAEGFWGPASNDNADCDAGPGCVLARPINPGPPAAPTGLAVRDSGIGGALAVSWQANQEKDVKSYTLRYGTLVGGPYSSKASYSAATTSALLTGLTDGMRYYMTLTAINTSGNESAPSAEASGVPRLIQGIAPPASITDLRVDRSGPDLVLTWSQPTVDIYGRPTTVARYDVYLDTVPAYVPSAANRLATLLGGTSTTFRHAGAATLAANLYYLVTATDSNGFTSGAGRDLPNGIMDLGLTLVSTNPVVVRLAWSAVTTDVQGYATLIDHYQIHRTASPAGRASLDNSTIFRDNVTGFAVHLDLTALPGPSYFSVIAVDDRGNLSPF